jgi:predicted nucleic acid-binding Zn ribbon protein
MQSLSSLMQQLEGSSPQWRSSAHLRQVLAVWPQVVGAAVAQHSQPLKIQRGVLQVTVSSAAWAQTLTFERLRILQKLHQRVPATKSEIQDLRFATAQWQRHNSQPTRVDSNLLSGHPSWVKSTRPPSQPLPTTAAAAFQQWSQRLQSQLATQSCCPRCQRPCPTAELQRWSVCAICATHQWYTPQGR